MRLSNYCDEKNPLANRKKPVLTGYSAATDSNSQMQGMKNEMNSHFALAMLGAKFDEDYPFHCR